MLDLSLGVPVCVTIDAIASVLTLYQGSAASIVHVISPMQQLVKQDGPTSPNSPRNLRVCIFKKEQNL